MSARSSPRRDQFLNTVTVLAQAVGLKDADTGRHSARVTRYSLMLGRQLGLPDRDLNLLEIGAPLHDLGKIGIDDTILRKPGRLTAEEFEVVKTHTTKGAAIVGVIPDLHPVLPIVRNHHERWDGGGYPDHLAGEQIPLLARAVAVAEAFDAITSAAPYHPDRKGRPPEEAFAELERASGRQLDPRCVAAFLAIRGPILEALSEFSRPAWGPLFGEGV